MLIHVVKKILALGKGSQSMTGIFLGVCHYRTNNFMPALDFH